MSFYYVRFKFFVYLNQKHSKFEFTCIYFVLNLFLASQTLFKYFQYINQIFDSNAKLNFEPQRNYLKQFCYKDGE